MRPLSQLRPLDISPHKSRLGKPALLQLLQCTPGELHKALQTGRIPQAAAQGPLGPEWTREQLLDFARSKQAELVELSNG